MPLNIPKQIEDSLAAADAAGKPLDEFELSTAIRNAVGDPATLSDAERLGARAELAAFRFGTRGDFPDDEDAYFGPIISGQLKDGSPYYDPDPRRVDKETVDYWRKRADAVGHPTLRARYADLVWQFCRAATGEKPNLRFAHMAIDSYLAAARTTNDEHQAWRFLERALELSLRLRDAARITQAKDSLFAYYRAKQDSGKKFMWWKLDDLLWEHRKIAGVSDAEQQELLAGLEHFLKWHSDPAKPDQFDPHLAQTAADRLSTHYEVLRKGDKGRAAVAAAGQAFEKAAANADGLVATAWLQDVIERYRQAGMAGDVARLEEEVRVRSADAKAQMKKIEVPLKISPEQIEQWLDQITAGPPEQALSRIALKMMARESSTHEQVLEQAKVAPLQALMPIDIQGTDGFTAARIGPVKDDIAGRVLHHATELFGFNAAWLAGALDRVVERHGLGAEQVMKFLTECPFFIAEKHSLIQHGIDAWLAGDSVKTIHTLVPQAEASLREMLRTLGGSVMRRNQSGGYDVIGMGHILHDALFRTKFDQNARLHFLALYTDPRGLNLRNRVAHGLVTEDQLGRGLANWVIHSLLLISCFRVKPGSAPAARS